MYPLKRYVELELEKIGKDPHNAEIIPPPFAHLEKLCEHMDSLVISIELWDEQKRMQITPGKYRLANKNKYLESWKLAVDFLGKGNVGSVLLVGLEDSKTTLEGARKMIEIGVIPTLLPFRPLDSSQFANHMPVNPTELIELENEITCLLKENNLDPRNQLGCASCGGCSIQSDLLLVAH